MFINLPQGLFDDELFYSAMARSAEMMDPPLIRATLVSVLDAQTVSSVIMLPTRLATASSNLLCLEGETEAGHTLLWRHTLYPYYARFVTGPIAIRAATSMVGSGGSAVYGLLGVRPSRVRCPDRLRYCEICVQADRARDGVAYWHRTHQLPGSMLCTVHGELLRSSMRLTSRARDRLTFHSLESSISEDDQPCLVANARPCENVLQAIASRNDEILRSRSRPFSVGLCGDAWDVRRLELATAGFAKGRQCETARLRDEMTEWFGVAFLVEIGCLPGPAGSDDWVARMVRPPRVC